MNIWESGRESHLLDSIIAGDKTIEGRLNRDKFAQYQVGDQVWLRRDHRDKDGKLQDGEPHVALVEITGIRHYNTSLEMTCSEDYKKIIPYADSAKSAADEYNKYYSEADQKEYGVLAIEFKLLSN